MLKIIMADGLAEKKQIEDMRARAAQTGEEITATAAAVLKDVRENGYAAVEKYSLRFDGAAPREIGPEELQAAYEACPEDLIAAMEEAAESIRDYNEKILTQSMEWKNPVGGTVGRVVRGLTRVGIYVPGGTAAYPSAVLMTAVPAQVAGVQEIVMVTPPTENLNQAVLAAAKIAGVDRVIGVGGIQAVAALAYGAGFIPRVDKICGPGNAYVAAAKRLVYGTIDKHGCRPFGGPGDCRCCCQSQICGGGSSFPGGARCAGFGGAFNHQRRIGAAGGCGNRTSNGVPVQKRYHRTIPA